MTDPSNGRVTLAVVKNEVSHVRAEVQQMRDELREWQAGCEQRVRELEQYREGSSARWSAHQTQHKQDSSAHQTQHNTERGAFGAIALVGNAIASAIGVFVKKP